MQIFQTIYVLLCFQVIIFRYIYCEQFLCNEDESSILSAHVCSLEGYVCMETSEFNMDYRSWNQPKLYIYHLSFNNSIIYYIPNGIFSHLPNVWSLDLSGCSLLELSRYDFKSATKLEKINLSNNNLTTLPDSSFNGADNLVKLYLAHNRITHINANALKSLSKLTHINLSANQIVTIPDNVFANFLSIEEIDLSYNSIVSFINAFDTINHFTVNRLNLNFNQITNISLGGANVEITELTVNNNALMAIDLNQNNVKILRADNNKLHNIGLAISECDLTDLSLKNNALHDFDFIRNMSKLQHLDLSFNFGAGQTIGSDTFAKLTKLITLRLESVNLTRPNFQMFSKLVLLQLLDISYNDLNSINFHMLSLLDNLKWLYINGNSLTNITLTEFEFLFTNLNEIDISDNNWQCDQLADILRKLLQLNVKSTVHPERLVTNERNIRGIRCFQNTSGWDNITKIPIEGIQPSVDIEMITTELNHTKSQMNELRQQNENVKFELAEMLNELNAARNQTKSQVNVLQQENVNLKFELAELLKEFNATLETNQILILNSDKLIQRREANDNDQIGMADDIKFIKIFLVFFIVALICLLAVICYRRYFKRPPLWIARFRNSTNTMATTVEENNI